MKKYLALILLTCSIITMRSADTNWKVHPIFDQTVKHIVDTPDYVYFTSLNSVESKDYEFYSSLFRFDKKGEELIPLSTSNLINGNILRDMIYNPVKGYLAVLYKDYNIDLIYNDGHVVNIPYYAQWDNGNSKYVNSMTIDPGNDRLYLATDFGYVAINDKKYEVADSRIYDTKINSFIRMGDDYLLLTEDALLRAPVSDPRLSIEPYTLVAEIDDPVSLFPLNDELCILLSGSNTMKKVNKLVKNGNNYEIEDFLEGTVSNIDYSGKGLVFTIGRGIHHFGMDGTKSTLIRPEAYDKIPAATYNIVDVWNANARQGLSCIRVSGESWNLTRDWMLPNAPATFATTSFQNHPTYGFLMCNYGNSNPTLSLPTSDPLQLSGLNKGRWTNYAPVYTLPGRGNVMRSISGMAIDPDNNKYVYLSSYHNGITRLNLSDPQDIIHLSREGDADNGQPGFVVLDFVPENNQGFSKISTPYFDKQGNLWMALANWDDRESLNPNFYCWLAEDRRATTSASNIRQPKHLKMDYRGSISNQLEMIPLLKTGKGMIVWTAGAYNEKLVLWETNNTPTDQNDDKIYGFQEFVDSDGNTLTVNNIRYLWEDPSTGYVWVCHLNGLFYFIPSQVVNGNYQLYRVKVPRNDGTNMADYLLDGVRVNHIMADSEGRKWFSTAGGGIICTSSDGREILEEFTSDNSPLPSDDVYAIGFNSQNNSLMISTAEGYVEYSLPVASTSSTKEDIKAYPNPVRPDYSGYVTITDIPTGSFVKIADSGGNLVKDLGVMSGFEMLWDLSDSRFNHVKAGVYYIMISPADEYSKYSTVGKILVMN